MDDKTLYIVFQDGRFWAVDDDANRWEIESSEGLLSMDKLSTACSEVFEDKVLMF